MYEFYSVVFIAYVLSWFYNYLFFISVPLKYLIVSKYMNMNMEICQYSFVKLTCMRKCFEKPKPKPQKIYLL